MRNKVVIQNNKVEEEILEEENTSTTPSNSNEKGTNSVEVVLEEDKDKTIQDTIKAPEVTNQDILKRTPIGGLGGQQLEMYLNAVADGGLTPEEAYKNVTNSNLAAFVTDDDGKIQFEEVTKQDGTKVFEFFNHIELLIFSKNLSSLFIFNLILIYFISSKLYFFIRK